MKDELAPAWAAGAIANAANAAAPTATAEARMMRWIEDMSQLPLSSGPLLAPLRDGRPERRPLPGPAPRPVQPWNGTQPAAGQLPDWLVAERTPRPRGCPHVR